MGPKKITRILPYIFKVLFFSSFVNALFIIFIFQRGESDFSIQYENTDFVCFYPRFNLFLLYRLLFEKKDISMWEEETNLILNLFVSRLGSRGRLIYFSLATSIIFFTINSEIFWYNLRMLDISNLTIAI